MAPMSDADYTFDGLPVDGIRPGTTVLVAGPTHAGTRELALRMLAGADGEGAIVVTTNQRADRVVEDCERAGVSVFDDQAAIIDCVSDDEPSVPARLLTVAGPTDLTGIGMRFSDLHRSFSDSDVDRVRTGLYSVSTLLTFSNLKTVSRFVHTLVGRIDSVDGLGVLVVDPTNHDEREVSTLAQFCAGRIDVRDGDGDGPELRTTGLPGHDRDWRRFDLSTTD